VALCQTAGGKKLSLDFNGAQSVPSVIQAVASSAGAETTISVNTAQVVPTGDLITLAQIAG